MSRKYRFNNGSHTNLYGPFDWRINFAGNRNRHYKFKTEEDYINSLTESRRKAYLKRRIVREAKWYTSQEYQRQLRLTVQHFKKIEKMKERLVAQRFKSTKIKDTEVPAECSALLNIAILESL